MNLINYKLYHKSSADIIKYFIFIFLITWTSTSYSQIVNLPCQSELEAFIGLDRNNFTGGSTDILSEASMHNFELPLNIFGDCKKISNIDINVTINSIDLTNFPPDCAVFDYFINFSTGCPSFDPASCNNIFNQEQGFPTTQTITFTDPPEDFQFGDNFGVDIVAAMSDVNCTDGQEMLTSGSIVFDYDLCVVVTVVDEAIDTPPNLGFDQTVCPNTTTILNPGTYSSYQWDPNGETSPTIDVGNGNYTVTVTDGNGCTGTDEISIFNFPISGITFDPVDPSACDGNPILVDVVENYSSYNWSTGQSGQSVLLPSGTHTVTITDANNCMFESSVTVSDLTPPNAGIDNFFEVCNDATLYDIDALLGNHDSGGTWVDVNLSGVDINTNPMAVDFQFVVPGTYEFTYTVTGTPPCAPDVATITIQVFNQNDAGTSNFYDFCLEPGNLDFYFLIGASDIGGLWSDIDFAGVDLNNPFIVDFNGVSAGTYEFEYTLTSNGPCPQDQATLTIIISDGSNAGGDNSTTLCEGSIYDLNDLLDMDATSGGTFNDVNATGSLTGSSVNTAGFSGQTLVFEYTVGSSGSTCGEDQSVLTINVESGLTAGEGNNGSLCSDGTIDLFDFLTNEDIGGTFSDLDGSGGLTGSSLNTDVIVPGTYMYQYLIGDGISCPKDSSIFSLTLFSNPSFGFSQLSASICEDQCEQIEVNFNAQGNVSFNLQIEESNETSILSSESLNSATNSYNITVCNIQGEFSFSNDTIFIPSDSSVLITIPFLQDDNCSTNLTTDTLLVQTVTNTLFQIDTTACITDTLMFGEIKLFNGNSSFTDTIPGQACDSIVDIQVVFTLADTAYTLRDLCPGDSVFLNNIWHTENNPYSETPFVSNTGCDSLAIVDVSFYPISDSILTLDLCIGDSLVVNDVVYDNEMPSGTEILEGQSINGCDSIVIISLSFSNGIMTTVEETLCPEESLEIGGSTFDINTPSGQVILPGSGCDTMVDVNLSFYTILEGDLDDTYCPDFSVTLNGNLYDISNPSGTEVLPNASAMGCDSTVNIDMSFYEESINTINTTLCQGDFIEVNGNTYDISMPSGTEILPNESSNGCDSTVIINLIFNDVYDESTTSSICEGDSIFLANEWQTTAGSYIDTFTTINNCDSILTTMLTISDCTLDVSLQSENIICAGDLGSIDLNINSAIPLPYVIVWENLTDGTNEAIGISSDELIVNIPDLTMGSYLISILDNTGAVIFSSTADIIELNPEITMDWIILDSIVCNADLGALEADIEGGQEPYTYTWNLTSVGNTEIANNIPAGEYQLTITDANNCTNESSFEITEPPRIDFSVQVTDPSCLNNDGQLEITNISGGQSPYSIFIDDTLTSSLIIDMLSPNIYSIEVSDNNDCRVSMEEELNVSDKDIFFEYEDNYIIEMGDSVRIIGEELTLGNYTFEWASIDASLSCLNCANPVGSPDENVVYSLIITNELGCTQEVFIAIEVLPREIIFTFPNAFSPNGDQNNDLFIFETRLEEEVNLSMLIFDRWGNKLYESVSNAGGSISWDGTSGNNDLSVGVYMYSIEIEYPDGERKMLFGDVTLIR